MKISQKLEKRHRVVCVRASMRWNPQIRETVMVSNVETGGGKKNLPTWHIPLFHLHRKCIENLY